LAVNGEKYTGSKMPKERLAVLLCGMMVGEMEKSLMIGKAAKPITFEVKLPPACSFIVDGLAFCC
jgi:hypothetical protein